MAYTNEEYKERIRQLLKEQGYDTYAERMENLKVVVTNMYQGEYIETAAMVTDTYTMLMNPGWFVDMDEPDHAKRRVFNQVSVLVRHEILHYILMHQKRFADHLNEIDRNELWHDATAQELANYAMDWDLSREGYDEEDKETVRNMMLGGRIIGGLILEDDHPEWMQLSMEQIWDKLEEQREKDQKNKPQQAPMTVNITKDTHSDEYTDIYNKVMSMYDNDKFNDAALAELIGKLSAGEDIDY